MLVLGSCNQRCTIKAYSVLPCFNWILNITKNRPKDRNNWIGRIPQGGLFKRWWITWQFHRNPTWIVLKELIRCSSAVLIILMNLSLIHISVWHLHLVAVETTCCHLTRCSTARIRFSPLIYNFLSMLYNKLFLSRALKLPRITLCLRLATSERLPWVGAADNIVTSLVTWWCHFWCVPEVTSLCGGALAFAQNSMS